MLSQFFYNYLFKRSWDAWLENYKNLKRTPRCMCPDSPWQWMCQFQVHEISKWIPRGACIHWGDMTTQTMRHWGVFPTSSTVCHRNRTKSTKDQEKLFDAINLRSKIFWHCPFLWYCSILYIIFYRRRVLRTGLSDSCTFPNCPVCHPPFFHILHVD